VNLQITRLFVVVIGLYAVLMFFTSRWAIFDSKELDAKQINRRPLLEQAQIHRGKIRTSDGETVAESHPEGKGSGQIYVRDYPLGDLFGNPVGYSFLDRGQTGIERSHNDDLVGNKTEFLSILDQLRGHRQVGDDLTTTLDASAQRTAISAMNGQPGAVVALEPDTGRVRVMASVPAYDPNKVSGDADFAALNRDPGAPLFNRATQSGYPPGSSFKVVTAAAALDSGEFTPDSQINGDSPKTISGVPLQNDFNQSFGNITLTDALTHSVNTVFAQVGEQLGKGTMFKYMQRFGFSSRPPLDYPADQMTASGVYQGRRLLGAGDSVDIGRVAIGQERLRVTPLQMAEVAATVANKGEFVQPRLWERVVDPDGRVVAEQKPHTIDRVMSEQSASELADMMANVVKEGTGTAAALSGISVAGKTGTAEVADGLNQAWFIAFAPIDSPKVAIAVTVEKTSGQGGTVAAPIAKTVMEQLLH
jgi:penicillin-binding protein A